MDVRSDLEQIWRDLYTATPMQTERGVFWKQKAVDALESAIDDPDCLTATGALVVSTNGLLCLRRLLVANNRLTYGDRTELLPIGEKFVIRISRLLGQIARARLPPGALRTRAVRHPGHPRELGAPNAYVKPVSSTGHRTSPRPVGGLLAAPANVG